MGRKDHLDPVCTLWSRCRAGAYKSPTSGTRASRFRAILFCVLPLAACGCGEADNEKSANPSADRPKNVVLVTLDALRQDHLSIFGYARETSPHIDWLAREGVVFRNIIPSGCSTKASLTSLYTSMDYRYHHLLRHGAVLDDAYSTLGEIFQENGYETAAFVATPHVRAELNYDQGFDYYQDFSDSWVRLQALAVRLDDLFDAFYRELTGSYKFLTRIDYITAQNVMDRALDFIRHRPEPQKPFFVYAHLEEPHPPWFHDSPWLESDEEKEQFSRCSDFLSDEELAAFSEETRENLVAKYDGAIRFADGQIGRLIDTLRDQGLLENTVIAIGTDHGIELLERYGATHGYNPFDEVVRGFLVLYDAGQPIETLDPDTIQGRNFDTGPTLFGLAGIVPPDGLDGVDLLSESAQLPPYAFSKCYNAEIVRSLDWKFFDAGAVNRENVPSAMPVGLHLYALKQDAGETRNVAPLYPERVAAMREALAAYRADLEREFVPVVKMDDSELDPNTVEMLRNLGYIESEATPAPSPALDR